MELLADRVVFPVGRRTWQPATDLDSLQDGDSLEHLTGRVRGLAPVAVASESSCLEEGEASGEGQRENLTGEKIGMSSVKRLSQSTWADSHWRVAEALGTRRR